MKGFLFILYLFVLCNLYSQINSKYIYNDTATTDTKLKNIVKINPLSMAASIVDISYEKFIIRNKISLETNFTFVHNTNTDTDVPFTLIEGALGVRYYPLKVNTFFNGFYIHQSLGYTYNYIGSIQSRDNSVTYPAYRDGTYFLRSVLGYQKIFYLDTSLKKKK